MFRGVGESCEVKVPSDLPAPARLMRAGLRGLPPPVLAAALRRISADLPRRHPALVRRLARLAPARILFAPTDVPHGILLTITRHGAALTLAATGAVADVTMRGTLSTLIDLLESRIDSDTVFFSRALAVQGDTGVAVAFRNTLDGESVSLVDDALSRLGPFTAPAERLAVRLHAHAERLAAHLAAWRDEAHCRAHDGHDPVADRQRILTTLDSLAARVGRLEARKSLRGAA